METQLYIQVPPNVDIFDCMKKVQHKCHGVQVYVEDRVTGSAAFWQNVAEEAKRRRLKLIAHLPDSFTYQALEAARIVAGDFGLFISHFQPHLKVKPIPWGVHGLENARFGVDTTYHDQWLKAANHLGHLAVFDIPRLFKNTDSVPAQRETTRILEQLNHYVLHLIDFSHPPQAREHFVPLGQGLLSQVLPNIPFVRPPSAVVLEFEDLRQSLDSLAFLRQLFPG